MNGSDIDEDEEKRIIEEDETPNDPSWTFKAQSVPQLTHQQQPSSSIRAESLQPQTFSKPPPNDNNNNENGRKRKREEMKAG